MNQRERRVREIAHRLWEFEGRPEGHSDRFWFLAVEEYEAEIVPAGDDKQAASVIEKAPAKKAHVKPKAEKAEAEKPAAKPKPMKAATAKAEDAPAKAPQSAAAKPSVAAKPSEAAKPSHAAKPSEAAKPKAPAKR